MSIILWTFAVIGAGAVAFAGSMTTWILVEVWRERRAKRADSRRQEQEAKAAQVTAARAARIVRLALPKTLPLPADDEFYVSLEYSLLQEATRLAATLCEGRSDPVDGQGE